MASGDVHEASSIALHLWIVSQRSSQFADDSGDVCIGGLNQAIVSPLAVATCGDESGAAEVSEVPRNLGLIGLKDLDAGADAEFLVPQQMNQPQTSVVGQCLENEFESVAHLKADYDLWSEVVSSRGGAAAPRKLQIPCLRRAAAPPRENFH